MFLLKLLFCLFAFCGSEFIFAFAERSCWDCVTITSCTAGLDFATQLSHGSLPSGSRTFFTNRICGWDTEDPRIPKVCCSEFPGLRRRRETHISVDSIENHQNIGLLPTSCGDIDGSRIVGGNVAKLYEFPWMTLIAYRTLNGLDFQCTGSIINSRYILTAAHCVIQGGKLKNIAGVRIGDFDYTTKYDCQGVTDNMICESNYQDIEVEEIIPHERFTGGTRLEDDIALLRLKDTITMAKNAAPICLPVYSKLRNAQLLGKSGTAAGWTFTESGTQSSKLIKTVIPILSDEACSHYYNRSEHIPLLQKAFCADKKDACHLGGPLMLESDFNGSIRMIQFGINSFGPIQCGLGRPDVYTDVTKYMEWILDNIRA